MPRSGHLELDAIRGTTRFVVLQLNGATTGRRRHRDLMLGQLVVVQRHPVANSVILVGRDQRHFARFRVSVAPGLFGLQQRIQYRDARVE